MQCPTCSLPGRPGHVLSTGLAVDVFADASQRVHVHDPNCHHRVFRCDNGHVWTKAFSVRCTTCGWELGPCTTCEPKAA